MAKRGVKKFEESSRRGMPVRLIAKELGISPRTVSYTLKHAQEKLKAIPGAFELICSTIHAVDASEKDSLQCGSVECNKEFIALFGDRK